jgi:hypothetical protein
VKDTTIASTMRERDSFQAKLQNCFRCLKVMIVPLLILQDCSTVLVLFSDFDLLLNSRDVLFNQIQQGSRFAESSRHAFERCRDNPFCTLVPFQFHINF